MTGHLVFLTLKNVLPVGTKLIQDTALCGLLGNHLNLPCLLFVVHIILFECSVWKSLTCSFKTSPAQWRNIGHDAIGWTVSLWTLDVMHLAVITLVTRVWPCAWFSAKPEADTLIGMEMKILRDKNNLSWKWLFDQVVSNQLRYQILSNKPTIGSTFTLTIYDCTPLCCSWSVHERLYIYVYIGNYVGHPTFISDYTRLQEWTTR